MTVVKPAPLEPEVARGSALAQLEVGGGAALGRHRACRKVATARGT